MGADTMLIPELILDHQSYKIKSSAFSKYEQYIESVFTTFNCKKDTR